jgi:hypothetical protein
MKKAIIIAQLAIFCGIIARADDFLDYAAGGLIALSACLNVLNLKE